MIVQVRIVKKRGRSKGLYRSLGGNNTWGRHWFLMTVAEAKKALRTGRAHCGGVEDCVVVPYEGGAP